MGLMKKITTLTVLLLLTATFCFAEKAEETKKERDDTWKNSRIYLGLRLGPGWTHYDLGG
jgi:hypothetical protein